jgi:hypothetical protein
MDFASQPLDEEEIPAPPAKIGRANITEWNSLNKTVREFLHKDFKPTVILSFTHESHTDLSFDIKTDGVSDASITQLLSHDFTASKRQQFVSHVRSCETSLDLRVKQEQDRRSEQRRLQRKQEALASLAGQSEDALTEYQEFLAFKKAKAAASGGIIDSLSSLVGTKRQRTDD